MHNRKQAGTLLASEGGCAATIGLMTNCGRGSGVAMGKGFCCGC